MALNANNNLFLGASHFHSTHSPNRHQSAIPESPDIHAINNFATSVHSLQAIYSLTPESGAMHYSNVKTSVVKSPSTSAITSSLRGNLATSTSLSHLNDISSKSTVNMKDDNNNKSSDDTTGSTGLSHEVNSVARHLKFNDKNSPIEIRVRCIFLRVGEIDTLNERYTSEIFFEASWYTKDTIIESKYDPQAGHFNPQLVVLNHMGDSLRHDKWYSVRRDNENGQVEITEYHKLKGVFWERMELNHFPYDVQELSISLTTPLTINDFYFTENKQKPSGVNRTVFSDEQSWYLYEHVEFQFEQHREEYSLNYDQIHPVVVCTCHVGRKCGYYIWNAYFLIFLITSASLCTFAIPPSNSHGRLQITCTLLLTSVTFRWIVNKSLPTISYLTALDIYAIASIVALCIINVFHGVISYIYYNQIYIASYLTPSTTSVLNHALHPTYSLCRLDHYGFYILSIAFCLYQVFILFWTFWTPYNRRRLMQQKDEKTRAELMNKIGK